jgi:hypothetical protein
VGGEDKGFRSGARARLILVRKTWNKNLYDVYLNSWHLFCGSWSGSHRVELT